MARKRTSRRAAARRRPAAKKSWCSPNLVLFVLGIIFLVLSASDYFVGRGNIATALAIVGVILALLGMIYTPGMANRRR